MRLYRFRSKQNAYNVQSVTSSGPPLNNGGKLAEMIGPAYIAAELRLKINQNVIAIKNVEIIDPFFLKTTHHASTVVLRAAKTIALSAEKTARS